MASQDLDALRDALIEGRRDDAIKMIADYQISRDNLLGIVLEGVGVVKKDVAAIAVNIIEARDRDNGTARMLNMLEHRIVLLTQMTRQNTDRIESLLRAAGHNPKDKEPRW